MNHSTIIYYTSNRENPKFEKRIQEKLLEVCGDTPIISVSQKPIDLGTNVCVGERETSNHNLFRQILIGARLATTPFVTYAEADCLYTPEYFKFIPEDINETYKCDNLYILNEWGVGEYSGFYQKEIGTFAQISGREYLIKEIEHLLEGRPMWDTRHRNERPLELFRRCRWKLFHIDNPIISLKTGNGMSNHTRIIEPPVDEIPYWGSADKIRKEYFI